MRMSLWLQVTSGQGPSECQWAARRVAEEIEREAAESGLRCRCLDVVEGDETDTCKSAVLAIDGDGAPAFSVNWAGTIQWISPSPYRPRHKRKNWFVGVEVFEPPIAPVWSERELRVDVMRSSGPGGQHVNKTSSAVRVTHIPTGLCAVAREERSQHHNRRLALARLAQLMEDQKTNGEATAKQERWQQHVAVQRGNPIRVYRGPKFTLRAKQNEQEAEDE